MSIKDNVAFLVYTLEAIFTKQDKSLYAILNSIFMQQT